MLSSCHTWLELLARRAESDRPWSVRPEDPRTTSAHRAVTFAELFYETRRVASLLQHEGVKPGESVIVVADNSVESAIFILGVLLGDAVVVPVPPPGLWQPGQSWAAMLQRIAAQCESRLLLLAHESVLLGCELPQGMVPRTFATLAGAAPASTLGRCGGNDVALIQFTSGTTSRARGVLLSHDNLFHTAANIGQALGASLDDVGVSWLPLFHDMGLIGGMLSTTCWGTPLVLMTPRNFALRPESWLWAISRFRATFSVAPNSAYHTCADKLPERKLQGLDLSRWRVALNGAELVHERTVAQFARRFAAYHFRSEAMRPVYGLAEHTVAATMPRAASAVRVDWVDAYRLEHEQLAVPAAVSGKARAVVASGEPFPGHRLRIADPTTQRVLPERAVGEIQLQGACVMRGYHGGDDGEAFSADGWLRSGDRGYLSEGELFVVGRYKDLIKRAGRAIDAAHIENLLRELPGVRGGRIAAFGVADEERGTERLVVLAESALSDAQEGSELCATISRTLTAELLPAPDHVLVVRPGSIPRTTSGKTRHADAREAYVRMRAEDARSA
jgi:acyl-CoA synthetase (AMP-forming)/AMP-acid ligase II